MLGVEGIIQTLLWFQMLGGSDTRDRIPGIGSRDSVFDVASGHIGVARGGGPQKKEGEKEGKGGERKKKGGKGKKKGGEKEVIGMTFQKTGLKY